jgi:Protein of unknown function (DUF2459)
MHDHAPGTYAPGPYPGSGYFNAVPRYSAFHTCNTWAAEALKAAGLPVRSRGVALAGQLWRQSRRLDAASLHAAGESVPDRSASPAAPRTAGDCGAPLGALIN